MSERPILFSGAMVRAILSGAKTQTRRIVKWRGAAPGLNLQFTGLSVEFRPKAWVLQSRSRYSWEDRSEPTPCPYGQPGDRLWVKETWCTGARLNDRSPKEIERAARRAGYATGPCCPVRYVADGQSTQWGDCDTHDFGRWGKTRVSIHMPRWASRLTLEITGVRVERLSEISDEDALAEGVYPTATGLYQGSPRAAYGKLWDSINAARRPKLPSNTNSKRYNRVKAWLDNNPDTTSWDANPWVWVVEFRRIGQCAREVCNAIPREHLPQVGTELIARPTPARGKCAEERAIDAAMGGVNG